MSLHEDLQKAEAENSPSTAAAIRAAIDKGEDAAPAQAGEEAPLPESDSSAA